MKPFSKLLKALGAAGLILFLILKLDGQYPLNTPPVFQSTTSHHWPEIQEATQHKVREGYGVLPLTFEANQGQIDSQVKFLSRGRGYTLFLTSNEAVLALRPGSQVEHQTSHGPDPEFETQSSHVVRMKLVSANPSPGVTGVQKLPGKSNYFVGNNPKKWQTHIPNYARVEYQNVYPGIDLVYYGNQGYLEHDFIVAPNADPEAIELEFSGVDEMEIDDKGNLVLGTPGGEIRQHKPIIYQEVDGVQHQIDGKYVLHEAGNPHSKIRNEALSVSKGPESAMDNWRIGFDVDDYDPSLPLVIDPVLSYSTYLGGSGNELGRSIAVDNSGNVYVTGWTISADFPTANPFQSTNNGGRDDIFITKLNASGSVLVYSTYLGDIGSDRGLGITVDASGNAYITGSTSSVNFPITAGAFQTVKGGSAPVANAFVTKLNTTGSALVYSTFIGGNSLEGGNDIAIDASGNAYITGNTVSSNFPTTAGAFQTSKPGGFDGFVTKLNTTGSGLVYSTYLGGSSSLVGPFPGLDFSIGIAVDEDGNAYVTGITKSTNFPTTAGAFQTSFGGIFDATVTKLNTTGSGLIYSTYIGGTSDDRSNGIAVDGSGNAYVVGQAFGNFPTANPIQGTPLGGLNAFVTKLNPAGSGLVYSTYLGGSGVDQGLGIAVDISGNTHVTGHTRSTNFPTAGATQASNAGGQDAFVAKISSSGSALLFSTYLGGSSDENIIPSVAFAGDITVDGSGNAFITGATNSSDFPTAGLFQGSNAGLSDVFVAKFDFTVLFAAFPVKVEIEDDKFEVKGSFTLGGASDGIDPLTEDVTLELGTFSTIIPAGSFVFKPAKPGKPAQFKFEGVIGGVDLEVKIIPLGGNVFDFKAEGEGADLTGTVNPVVVTLTIGDDTGTTSVTAELDKTAASNLESAAPEAFLLFQNYPNPFNPETVIRFHLPETSSVVVRIFNMRGQEIRRLAGREFESGFHTLRWDAKDRNGNPVSSGIYLYQLQAGHFSQVNKMSLLR